VPEPAETAVDGLTFDAAGLLPAVVQDDLDGTVLMVGWMDAEAVRRTLTTGRTWFWSRSRQAYWQKGETSGHTQHVRSVTADCDRDTLLVRVVQKGPVCHTGSRSCFASPLPVVEGPIDRGQKAPPEPPQPHASEVGP
jgi:phosphoribosyl-AMP cyclohydrolase